MDHDFDRLIGHRRGIAVAGSGWRSLALLSLGFLMSFPVSAQAPEPSRESGQEEPSMQDAISRWLSEEAIPLRSVEAGQGFEDLQPLEVVLKDVRIVALGEATHGAREFFQVKHRLLEFLVTRMGFNIFAIETSYPACLKINEYVLHGKGDRAAVLAGQGYWTWDTEEVAALIDWMREYNRSVPEERKVKFLGFDLNNHQLAFEVIESYLERVSPDSRKMAESAFEPLRLEEESLIEFYRGDREEISAAGSRLESLMELLRSKEAEFTERTSAEEYRKVSRHARLLFQTHDYLAGMFAKDKSSKADRKTRDYYMAENARYIFESEGPQARMVVWGHNGHISRSTLDEIVPSMGHYLSETYGDAYYALALSFHRGSFQAWDRLNGGIKEFTAAPVPEDSLPWHFARSRQGREDRAFIVDLRSAPEQGSVADWLSSPQQMHSIGSTFSTQWTVDHYMPAGLLRKRYDGILFIESITRARPNPTGIR